MVSALRLVISSTRGIGWTLSNSIQLGARSVFIIVAEDLPC
jgi:hypothetical protein